MHKRKMEKATKKIYLFFFSLVLSTPQLRNKQEMRGEKKCAPSRRVAMITNDHKSAKFAAKNLEAVVRGRCIDHPNDRFAENAISNQSGRRKSLLSLFSGRSWVRPRGPRGGRGGGRIKTEGF